jgi:threonine dehydratase
VTEFNYRYGDQQAAQVFVSIALTQGRAERDSLIKTIAEAGFAARDMTDNEMAKLHVRYMVGGRAHGLTDERLYRFEFPERPGALLKFLRAIGTAWNISLFHYRNHGSDYGRILTGIQVPPDTREDFILHVNELQYAYTEETDNPAYKMFLGG